MTFSRLRRAPLALLLLGALLFMAGWLVSCQAKHDSPPPPASAEPSPPDQLPKLVLKDDTPNLFLTWVSDDGDFHVVQKIDAVPAPARKQVRVVTDNRVATNDWFYVADLSRKNADGSYPVTTISRAAWDEIGADRRKSRLEAQAPSAAPSTSAAPAGSAAPVAPGAPTKPAAGASVSAIIYGADWCKPCHAAEDYLKQRGVRVVKKDVDNSDAARAEMRQKLDRAGMGGASIPIIDLMGQLLVGYSPSALDRAIASARNSKTL